jgi:hypothetical protein
MFRFRSGWLSFVGWLGFWRERCSDFVLVVRFWLFGWVSGEINVPISIWSFVSGCVAGL